MTGTAVVVGATGAAGYRLVEQLLGGGWRVIALSRRARAGSGRLQPVAVDLLDAGACARALGGFPDVSHVFYTARAEHGEDGREAVAENTAMLRHVLDAVEAASPALRHVHLVQGGKYYGSHLGPFATPAREDDPRHLPPNFYYDQQDLLMARSQGRAWRWSASRPSFITDFAPDRPRNLVSLLGAYGALCAELGVPLDFPGRPAAWDALMEITDATLLARGMIWMATDPRCADQAFNLTNGDAFRWRRLWPRLAAFFGVPVGSVRSLPLARWMADKEPVWQRIVARHGLRPTRLDQLAVWAFGDFVFGFEYDVLSSMGKARQLGFLDAFDSEARLLEQLVAYREAGIVP